MKCIKIKTINNIHITGFITDIVKLLLDNNYEVIDNNGLSPALHSACKGGSVDIVDLLLRNKCNINHCQPRTNQNL
jgi:ankyrin repeat protein